MSDQSAYRDRFEELKVERALFGLTESEFDELMELSDQLPNEDLDDLERVVAAVDQLLSEPTSVIIPSELRSRLEDQGHEFVRNARTKRNDDSAETGDLNKSGGLWWLPWLVSAASLAFAFSLWYADRDHQLTVAQQRNALIAQADDIVSVEWSPGPQPIEGASGDIVWSAKRQLGYMLFRNLPMNDPAVEQYQLWIFARNQDEAKPIDGGVFDITDSIAVIPIDAKLKAEDVYLFAVTIEKPGGVVVSDRQKLPLLAQVN